MWLTRKNKLPAIHPTSTCLLFVVLLFVVPQSIQAKNIPSSYLEIAYEYSIPAEILYGIALAESGKRLRSKKYRPWPWTLNVAGVPRRYPSRKSAWRGLMFFLKNGIKSIDIGLMQVNWRYHHKKLGTPWKALEPFNNAQTGAKILRTEYKKTGNWNKAIGYYHSPGQKPNQKKRAREYAARVMKQIKRINSSKR